MKSKHKHYAVLTASTLGLAGFSFASGFGDEKYTYDASGNVLEKQIGDQVTRYDYTGNQLNGSVGDSGSRRYAYDSSGRLTSDSEAGKPTRNMEHQYLDKVTKVQIGDKTTEFFYNAEGQLVATSSAGTSEAYAWDGIAMVNRGEKLYVNEAHSVGGVPAIIGDEVAVSDMIGTSISVGNGSFESTAFGEGLVGGLFTGKPFVSALDCFVFKYRNYSPDQIRWNSSDPTGFPDGTNNVEYARSNPLCAFDPLGLETVPLEATTYGKTQIFSGNGYVMNIKSKVTSTYTDGPEEVEGSSLNRVGALPEDHSWSGDASEIRIPLATAGESVEYALNKYKRQWLNVNVHVDATLTWTGGSDVYPADGVFDTEFAREN